MKTAVLILVPPYPRLIHMVDNALLKMVVVSERIERWHMFEKDEVRTVKFGAAILDVVNDGPSNSIRNRQGKRLLRFLLNNGKYFTVPVEIVKTKRFDVADSKSKNTS